jgi:hypothetical protein
MLACRVFGHRPHFEADGHVMRWHCDRGCGFEGSKDYNSTAEARRYAAGLNERDSDSIGRRPILAFWPLRLLRRNS